MALGRNVKVQKLGKKCEQMKNKAVYRKRTDGDDASWHVPAVTLQSS